MAEAASASVAGPGASQDAVPGAAQLSMLDSLRELWEQLLGLLNDRIELLTLELRRAGTALVQIVVLVVAGAILGATAWLVLWGAIVTLLVAAGLPLVWALAVALLINVGGAAAALARARRLLPLLRLPATHRHLMLKPSPPPRPHSDSMPDERRELQQPLAP
jgi:hypothetical protein